MRILAAGVFDMFHIGHAATLEQAKKHFTNVHLIVGVTSDEDILKHKGRNVMLQAERAEILKHCRWVDEVICPCPHIISIEFLEKNNINFVVHEETSA